MYISTLCIMIYLRISNVYYSRYTVYYQVVAVHMRYDTGVNIVGMYIEISYNHIAVFLIYFSDVCFKR